jgi:hypothetical protein
MLPLTLSGCVGNSRIARAAAEVGKARAGIVLPVLPGECRRTIDHALAPLGANAVVVLARERAQLDQANGVIRRCAGQYDRVKIELEGGN